MKRLKRSTKITLAKITALFMFAVIVITNTAPLYAETVGGETVEESPVPSPEESVKLEENTLQDQTDKTEAPSEEIVQEPGKEAASGTPEDQITETTDDPVNSPNGQEAEASVSDSGAETTNGLAAGTENSLLPEADPKDGNTETPVSDEKKTDASVGCSDSTITGSGLNELTISFDTEGLSEEESFSLILTTGAEGVTLAGAELSQTGSGSYRAEGMQKGISTLTFGNLNGADFTLYAEGMGVSFVYNAQNEVKETESGMTADVGITAASEMLGMINTFSADGAVEAQEAICINTQADYSVSISNGEGVNSRDKVFNFLLNYNFNKGVLPSTENPNAYFNIPEELTYLTEATGESGEIVAGQSDGGVVVGTYRIEGDSANGYRVNFNYTNEGWLKEHSSEISGSFKFSAKVKTEISTDKSEVRINFGGSGGDITIKFEDGTVNAWKNCTVNSEGLIDCVITFDVKDKSVTGVTLTDTLGSNLEFVSGSFELEAPNGTKTKIEDLTSGQQTTIGDLSVGKYYLRYQVRIQDSSNLDPTSNKIKWNWSENTEGDKEQTTPITFREKSIIKDGKQVGDYIQWVIEVTPSYNSSVEGTEIKDILGPGLQYEGSYEIYEGSRYWWDSSKPHGSGIMDASQGSFTHKFDSSKDGIISYEIGKTYVIVYNTKVVDPSVNGTYQNTVNDNPPTEVDYSSKSPEANADIVSKTGTVSDDENKIITWTITIDPSKYTGNGTITDLTLTDEGQDYYNNHYEFDQASLSIKDASGNPVEYEVKSWGTNKFEILIKGEFTKESPKIYVSYQAKTDKADFSGYVDNKVNSGYKINGTPHTEEDWGKVNIPQKEVKKEVSFSKSGEMNGMEAEWTILANYSYYPGNGKIEYINHHKNISGTYIIEDELPAGMDYVDGSAQIRLGDYVPWGDEPQHSWTFGNVQVAGRKLIFTFSVPNEYPYNACYIQVKYRTEIKDLESAPVNGDSYQFTNNALIKQDETTLGSGQATVNYTKKVLDKSGVLASISEAYNRINYTITVNYDGAKLSSNSRLTLLDTIDPNVTLDLNSVKVMDLAGNEISDYKVSYNSQRQLTLDIPDEKALRVTYGVVVAGKPGDRVTVSNHAVLTGTDSNETTTTNTVTIRESSATITGKNGSITLRKFDTNSIKTLLAGATFELYKVENTGESLVATQTSGSDGLITFEQENDGTSLSLNQLYYYVETKAPDGYQLDETKHYFILKGNDEAEFNTAAEAAQNLGISFATVVDGGGKIYSVSNEMVKKTISGKKIWDDNNDQDGKRPQNITINLLADGQLKESKEVTAADGWKWSFTDLPEYKDGVKIEYTITEDEVVGYEEPVITGNAKDGFTVTNTYSPETITVEGSKTWNDDGEADDRPGSIIIKLYANGVFKESKEVTAADGWKWSFTDLPKYADKTAINYTISEVDVENYTSEINGYDVTNTHTPGKTGKTVQKVWDDKDNQDGKRPTSIEVQLLADGDPYGEPVTLDEKGEWKYSWSDLPTRVNGKTVNYTVKEIGTIEGYTTTYSDNSFTITNKHTPKTINISGTKTWDDGNNQDGKRPASITINLLDDADNKVDSVVVTPDSNGVWSYSFNDLPMYKNGKEIVYRITEEPVAGYQSQVNGYNVTNTRIPETTEVEGSKTWVDDGEADRPESITIKLLANGEVKTSKEVTAKDDWKWSFTNLPKYKGGNLITYSIIEDRVDNYTATYDGYSVTNTHTPGETSRTVIKDWDDNNNQDGKRPDGIKVQLLVNGNPKGDKVELNAENNWRYTWTSLPERENGKTIEYTVEEIEKISGYTSSSVVNDNVTTITNTHAPETTNINGTKTWKDGGNQDGLRPEKITIKLLKNGADYLSQEVRADGSGNWSYSFNNVPVYENGNKINYTIEEVVDGSTAMAYQSEVNGYNVTNTHTLETTEVKGSKTWVDDGEADRPASITIRLLTKDGEVAHKVVTKEDGWKWSFTGLPKYKDGNLITYFIKEDPVNNYSPSYIEDGYSVTNTHTPGETSKTVTKVWDDNNNQDGKRPASIKVQLLANGNSEGKEVELNNGNNWTYTWTGLPERKNGKTVIYTVKEIGAIDGYEPPAYSDDSFTITNTRVPETTDISGTKTWDDGNNQDGKRPTSITIKLLKNGADYLSTEVRADESGNWNYSFNNVPVYENGNKINYTIKEVVDASTAADYESVVNGYNVTNTHNPEKTEVSVKKEWIDEDNQDGKRPASVTVDLLAGGTQVDSVELNEQNGWMHTFKDLDKYKNGQPIAYTVSEEAVTDYSTKITGTIESGYTITNSYTPGKTSYSVTKKWEDNNDQDGKRPASIQVQLYANGNEKGDPVNLSDANSWKYTWNDLDEKSDGNSIQYTVQEVVPAGYKADYLVNSGSTIITNTHETEKINISGTKTWKDGNDQDGKRPDIITINLLANGNVIKDQKVSAAEDGSWSYSFTNLPKYANGNEITYTVEEVMDESAKAAYQSKVDGYNITNTHTPEKTEIHVEKKWSDENNQDGKRPESVTVYLLVGEERVGTVILNDNNGWKHTFTNLDKYKNGQPIVYTVSEEAVTDYSTEITGTMESGYTITNSYTPGKTSIEVEKVWKDVDDQDGKRPDKIQVQLYANQVEKGNPVTLNSTNNWKYTWNELAKKSGGNDIVYTVEEVGEIGGYTTATSVNGNKTTITNTYVPEEIRIEGTKVWDDNQNQDKARPERITISLYADGILKTSQEVTGTGDTWSWSFENQPKFRDHGTEIVYTVKEEKVTGYEEPVITGNAKDGFTVTNTHKPETVTVEGNKTWVDNDNAAGARPKSITINLLADEKKIDSKKIEPDANGNWPAWKFENLPKYENGKEIKYTISEETVTDYSAQVNGYNVTNTYMPETTMVTVTKEWVDENDADGLRPTAIWVQLYKDKLFDKAVGDPIKLYAGNNWTHTWPDLPKRGFLTKINYTVKELGAVGENDEIIGITGYTSKVGETTENNIVITNTKDTSQPTPTATQTPGSTSTPQPTSTPETTPTATPETTPAATSTPEATATPEVTPNVTATPGVTATPEVTPGSTPDITPVPEETPEITPGRERHTTPTPAMERERRVLGASRTPKSAVLGAKRGLQFAVLGRRRRPSTGDSAAMIFWVIAAAVSFGGVITSLIMLNYNKRNRRKR